MAIQLPTDKTRRKRLKVISACSECRRKKTKCNGEKPCAGCIKTNVECKYSTTPKSKAAQAVNTNNTTSIPTTNTPTTTTSAAAATVGNHIIHSVSAGGASVNNHSQNHNNHIINNSMNTMITATGTNNNSTTSTAGSTGNVTAASTTTNSNHSRTNINMNTVSHHQNTQNSSHSRIETKSAATIHAIENRLSVIEDILQVLLLNSTARRGDIPSAPSNSAFHHRNMHSHSGPYCGEMYPSATEHNKPRQEKRRYSELIEDDYHYYGNHNTGNTAYHHYPQQYPYHPQAQSHRSPEMAAPAENTHHQPSTTFISHNVNDPMHVRLPPLNYRNSSQPPLSESCSTSTASSTCSTTSSPKINTIQTLLNDDDKLINEYPSPTRHEDYSKYRPSAFYRPTAGTDHA